MEKTWDEETITQLLKSNNHAVERAIIAIYARQTQDEKHSAATKFQNSVGFSAADARVGTYYANWINSGRRLSGSHLERARSMAIKYRRQLLSIANEKKQLAESSYQEKGKYRCDTCNLTAPGTQFYHNGTPVLALCDLCSNANK